MTAPMRAMIAILVLGAASTATAQAETAIIKCVWTNSQTGQDGSPEVYKISSSGWLQWDDRSWGFTPRYCGWSITNIESVCEIYINENEYIWIKKGYYFFDGGPKNYYRYDGKTSLRIDRRTGGAVYESNLTRNSYQSETYPEQIHLSGKCERTTDPSLQPKPTPNL